MLNLIKRERIYIWMLFFILAINLINLTGNSQSVKKADYAKKEYLSAKSFQELGITEEKVKAFFGSKNPYVEFFKWLIIVSVIVFITSFILNLIFILRKKKIPFPKICPDKRFVPWGILDIFKTLIIIIFISYILTILEGFIFKILHINMDFNLRMILNTFFIDITTGIIILYFVLVRYREGLSSIGLKLSGFFKGVLSGITAYIFILPTLVLVLLLSVVLLDFLGYKVPPQPVFEIFIEEKRNNVLLFLTIFVSVFGPIIEEIFFRGFVFSAIKKRLGVLKGALLSAAMFSLLHTNIVGFVPIMVLGMLMAYLYETTSSLVAPMTVHILHNSIIVAFVFFIKEMMK